MFITFLFVLSFKYRLLQIIYNKRKNKSDRFFFIIIILESRKFLLYARQIEIRGVDIDNPYYNYIISFTVPDIDNVTVVDYDAVEHRIYWSDVRTQTIKRAFINGTGVETVVSAGKNNQRNISVIVFNYCYR